MNTNAESFNNISGRIKDIETNSGTTRKLIYLIGNKIDEPNRIITKEKGENFADSLGIKYFEISCKYDINITEVISNMILEYLLKTNQINSKDIKNIRKASNIYKGKKILDKYINY